MNRRKFLTASIATTVLERMAAFLSSSSSGVAAPASGPTVQGQFRVAVLPVDMDRVTRPVDERIYGQFLEHINHSVEDGLFAERIRGAGFEGDDFKNYWESFSDGGTVEIANVAFQNGRKSVRLTVEGGHAGIRQRRIFLNQGSEHGGSLWAKRERGSPELTLRIRSSRGDLVASVPLVVTKEDWQEIAFSFTSFLRDTNAAIEIVATGNGTVLVDFISMMSAVARRDGMLRPDLLQALNDLHPSFIRWPGGSFASTYKWKKVSARTGRAVTTQIPSGAAIRIILALERTSSWASAGGSTPNLLSCSQRPERSPNRLSTP